MLALCGTPHTHKALQLSPAPPAARAHTPSLRARWMPAMPPMPLVAGLRACVPNHSSLPPFPVAGRDRRRPPRPRDRPHKMRLTCFALLARLAVLAAAQNPCALECRRQTCSSLNHSFSCEELSGFGCDCVSRCGVLKPHAHSRSRASHTYRRPRTLTGGLLRRRAGSLLAAATTTSTRQAASPPQAAGSDRRPPHQRRRRRRPWPSRRRRSPRTGGPARRRGSHSAANAPHAHRGVGRRDVFGVLATLVHACPRSIAQPLHAKQLRVLRRMPHLRWLM